MRDDWGLSFLSPYTLGSGMGKMRKSRICNPYRVVFWALLDVFTSQSYELIVHKCYGDQFVRFARSRSRV